MISLIICQDNEIYRFKMILTHNLPKNTGDTFGSEPIRGFDLPTQSHQISEAYINN